MSSVTGPGPSVSGNGPPAAPPTPPPASPPPLARLRRARRGALPESSQSLPLRRRWGRFALGAVLALLGAWVFAALYVSAGERVEVLAMRNDVGRFEEIDRDDLRTVRVAADEGVDTIDASDAGDLVGRLASTELREGSLLADSQLVPEDSDLIGADEAVVAANLPQSAAPDQAWEAGMDVIVVIVPPETGGAAPEGEGENEEIEGWLYNVGDLDDQTRTRQIDLVVPDYAAAEVAAAAADERVVLALAGG
jgi:hypothetical protein